MSPDGRARAIFRPAVARAHRTCGSGGACSTTTRDGFVSELSADGSQLLFSTFLGGSGDDSIASIAVDSTGHVHVAGLTLSSDFPITSGALQSTFAGGNGTTESDGFYARLSADGGTLQYSTTSEAAVLTMPPAWRSMLRGTPMPWDHVVSWRLPDAPCRDAAPAGDECDLVVSREVFVDRACLFILRGRIRKQQRDRRFRCR